MVTDKTVYLTKQGLKKLKKEYKELVEVKRPQLVKRIARAREMGDLSENSEYQDARDKLRFLDDQIVELQKSLSKPVVIEHSSDSQVVGLGCQVFVRIGKDRQSFVLVGELEADPGKRRISYQSPLGRAFIGKKVGDKVKVVVPAGEIVYLIEKIG